MRERDVEKAIVQAVKKAGGVCWKWTSPGTNGVPDRIALLPNGRCAFIEVKAPGQKPTKLQQAIHGRMAALGHRVYVIDNPEQIGGVLDEVQSA